jgi:hypothetical protein
MHYILQENVFRERHYDMIEKSLIKFNLPYTKVRLFPFVDKIVSLSDLPDDFGYNVDELPEFDPGTKNVFCFGAIKLARIASKKGWFPGSMMNENHDFMVYKEFFKEELLNYDSVITNLSHQFYWEKDEVKFIRPTQDTKSFTGALFTEVEWRDSVEHNLHNYRSEIFNENTLIQVSSPKQIYQEIRCWVVNKKVITASNYRIGNEVIYKRVIDEVPLKYAQSMVDKFQLNEAFVIDICETETGWKIVECGCINCAGFYDADLQKLLVAIEDHFQKER